MCLQLVLLNTSALANEMDSDHRDIYEEDESLILDSDAQNSFLRGALKSARSSRSNVSGVMSGIMSNNVRAYDPINRKSYTNVLLGKVYRTRLPFQSYTHYRYITVYNKYSKAERIAYLPFHEEGCHDNSPFMAEWGESRTVTVTLEAKTGAEAMGLSASVGMSISEGTTFSTSRRIKGVLNVRARHIPIKLSETHQGVTYLMGYNSKTKKHFTLNASNGERLIGTSYPYRFKLDNQNVGLRVKREVLEYCPGYDADAKASSADPFSPRF